MRKTVTLLAASAVVAGGVVAASAPANAASRQYCEKGSSTSSGRCYTTAPVKLHSQIVEAVPLVNDSSKTATLHCSFSVTVTRSESTSISVSAEVKAGLFDLVDASTSTTVSKTKTQTAAQATEAGGSVTLKPHQRVTCERTYGYVTSTVTMDEWHGLKGTTKKFSVNIPSTLGVRLVD